MLIFQKTNLTIFMPDINYNMRLFYGHLKLDEQTLTDLFI